MRAKPPRTILVEEAVKDSSLVHALRSTLPSARFETVEQMPEGLPYDRDMIEVVDFKGRFLKSCPGTHNYLCCSYKILHFGMQCTLDCSYCILQAYLNQPNLRLFGNTEAMLRELTEELDANPSRLYRVGTGEFTDSLLLDPWTRLSRTLVPLFARRSNAVLELKTKTDFIANLSDLDHKGRTIAAWSLNAPYIRNREESRATTLHERLDAAARCAKWGYPLAFHFDPMIEHPGWRQGYGEVLDRLFERIDPARVVWISLGALRFMPELKAAIQLRHPRSKIVYGELIRGMDGKMRYFRDIRVELYRFMVERIRNVDPGLCVYLCMEGEDIWREAFGYSPEERGGLPAMLDEAARSRIGI